MRLFSLFAALFTFLAASAPAEVSLRLEPALELKAFSEQQIELLEKLNRRDRRYLARADRVVVPESFDLHPLEYSPLPRTSTWAASQQKALIVDLRIQVFGGYEFGQLVRWGPISSGRQRNPTPPGHFNLNWRSRKRVSTDNSAWLLEWYYNFHNTRGIAFHKYAMPGRPASHACIRLLERDAIWLYEWGEGWTLSEDRQTVLQPGTPVWIIGQYDFGAPPPWLDPLQLLTPIQLPEQEPAVTSG